MRSLFCSVIFPILFAFSAISLVEFDPSRLTKKPGKWGSNDNTEKFYDYFYDGDLVFHVLERWVPAVNSLIVDALEKCRKIAIINADNVFITSQEDIKNMLSIVEPECSFIEIDPKKVTLSFSGFGSYRKYFIKFSTDESRIELSKNVYKDMKQKRILALASNKILRIDSNKLNGDKGCTALITVIFNDLESNKCVVCLNAKKEIMITPCNHICLCEECAKKIEKNCPVCRTQISGRNKVFY